MDLPSPCTPLKMNGWNPKNEGLEKMSFFFKQVIFRFHPLFFSGLYSSSLKIGDFSTMDEPMAASHPGSTVT